MTREYHPGWCPDCGEPEAVCRAWGGCADELGIEDDDDPEPEDPDEDESDVEAVQFFRVEP